MLGERRFDLGRRGVTELARGFEHDARGIELRDHARDRVEGFGLGVPRLVMAQDADPRESFFDKRVFAVIDADAMLAHDHTTFADETIAHTSFALNPSRSFASAAASSASS